MTKVVCQLDPEGYFAYTTVADESPLEPGVFLIPGSCVDANEPVVPDGMRARWSDGWVLEELPPPPEPLPEPTEYVPTWSDHRRSEYPHFSDYLDGVVKGDQAQIDKYIADCLAVKNKYPKTQE
jgi:hypothetical protein